MKVAISYHDYLLAMRHIRTARSMRNAARRLTATHAYVLRCDADYYALRARRIWDRIEWVNV
jgi:hypothetical protein